MAEVMEKSKKEESSVPAKAESKSDRPSNLCCYSQRICNLEKLKGFDFCHKHILEDKASPFKPCDFVAKSNGRRCPNPAPKLPDRGKSFCIIHTRKAELRRAVEERRKRRHHEGDGEESYDGIKEKRRRTSSSNSHKSDKLDGHSSDEEGGASGDDYLKVDSAWHGDIDSDADSVDSEEEDSLKHAGVWTVEEATRMCRDKMIRLRSLYIAQFRRLQHVLKERKRKYCQAIQAEEEEETGECHLTPTQLLSHKSQHEHPGTETLLHKQAKEKKQGTSTRPQTMSTLRCTFSPGGNRCTEKVLPLTKHCIKHITHDPNQLLFQKCAFQSKGDSQCERNVAKIFNHTSCRLHMELPPSMKRPDVKKDLQDAEERAKLRKARALEQNDKPDVPEALQQKSSALVPPSITGQSEETAPTTSEAHQDTSSLPSDTLSAGSEKMDIDGNDSTRKTDGECKVSTNSACAASASATPSAASVSDPSESISPGLAAASLVAVCSSPQLPLQGAPLSSICGLEQSSMTDSKSSPAVSGEQQSIGNAPSENTKGDADSKLPDATDTSVKDTKEARAVELKDTVSKPQEMTEKDAFTAVLSEGSGSAAKQPEEFNVAKDKEEGQVPAPASQSVSQTVAQGTTPVVASSKVISPTVKIVPQHFAEDFMQVTLKSASQGTYKTSKVTSPISIKAFPLESSESPSKVTSKSASYNNSNILKVTSSATTKVVSRDSLEESSQVASKSALQSSSKGVSHETHKTTAQGTSLALHTAAKQTSLVTSGIHPSQSTTASYSPSQPSKTNTAKPHITCDTPRSTPVKPFQHLPSGMTSSSSKQFSAITSVSSKESNKDSKTDLAKPKDQGDLGKL